MSQVLAWTVWGVGDGPADIWAAGLWSMTGCLVTGRGLAPGAALRST